MQQPLQPRRGCRLRPFPGPVPKPFLSQTGQINQVLLPGALYSAAAPTESMGGDQDPFLLKFNIKIIFKVRRHPGATLEKMAVATSGNLSSH